MRKTIKFLFVFICLLLIGSCRKYPDDPFISILRPAKRIQGDYLLEHYYVNGFDSATTSKYSFYTSTRHIFVPHHSFALYEPSLSFWYDVDMGTYVDRISNRSFRFADNHKSLYIPSNFLVFYSDSKLYKIEKLTNKELWITSTFNGKSYEVRLKK